jgi:hypothetical protein
MRAGERFDCADLLHGRGGHERAVFLERRDCDGEVGRVREGGVVDDRGGEGCGGVYGDGAAAEGLEDGDGDGRAAAKGGFLDGGVEGGVEGKDEGALGMVAGEDGGVDRGREEGREVYGGGGGDYLAVGGGGVLEGKEADYAAAAVGDRVRTWVQALVIALCLHICGDMVVYRCDSCSIRLAAPQPRFCWSPASLARGRGSCCLQYGQI